MKPAINHWSDLCRRRRLCLGLRLPGYRLFDNWTGDRQGVLTTRVSIATGFQEKWRLALTLLVRRGVATGLMLTTVVVDADEGTPARRS